MWKILQIGKLVLGVGFAKSGRWEFTGKSGRRHIYVISLHMAVETCGGHDYRALSLVAGPFTITVGIA